MRLTQTRNEPASELLRRAMRLEGLPLRFETAYRAVEGGGLEADDPGWVLGRRFDPTRPAPMVLVADRPYWPSRPGPAAEALDRLWRHGVATQISARSLAQGAGDPDPDLVARVGLLHNLGYWLLAAVDPDRLAEVLAIGEPSCRRLEERRLLGIDAAELGRSWAERRGMPPLLADAAWLHANPAADLDDLVADPARIALIRRARRLAERTPWALGRPEVAGPGIDDPDDLRLIAQVESACSGPFAGPVTPREARLVRSQGRLRLDLETLRAERSDRDRLVDRLGQVRETLERRAEEEEPERRAALLESLAEFAAGAGHELNNPLAVIVGRAQLLLGKFREPDAARSLRAIIAQAQRASRILRDLMYVARPPTPRNRPCLPDDVLRACLRDLRDEAIARGIRLEFEFETRPVAVPGSPPTIALADPDALRQLAEILLRNAFEATPAGGTIRVTTASGPGSVEWTFLDSGRGMAPSESRHLFDPFFCGRQAGRGLGLGLPRAARFVERSGGELRWRSEPGRGTCVHLRLPLTTVESSGEAGARAAG